MKNTKYRMNWTGYGIIHLLRLSPKRKVSMAIAIPSADISWEEKILPKQWSGSPPDRFTRRQNNI